MRAEPVWTAVGGSLRLGSGGVGGMLGGGAGEEGRAFDEIGENQGWTACLVPDAMFSIVHVISCNPPKKRKHLTFRAVGPFFQMIESISGTD